MWENKGFKGSWIWRHVSEDTYNQCIDLGGLDNKITSFMIWDGCCAFYANKGCNDRT